jgi:hypothetical protein
MVMINGGVSRQPLRLANDFAKNFRPRGSRGKLLGRVNLNFRAFGQSDWRIEDYDALPNMSTISHDLILSQES